MRLENTPKFDIEVDLSGLRCPHILMAVIFAVRGMEEGQILKIVATDLNAPSSITAWSKQSLQPLIDFFEEGERFVFFLQRSAVPLSTP